MTDEDRLVKMFMGNGMTMPTMLPCASDEEFVMFEFVLRSREASYGGRRGILCKGLRAVLRCPRNVHLLMSTRSRDSIESTDPTFWAKSRKGLVRTISCRNCIQT
eukprot:scaffold114059_cov53-Attheya_sp.AAC.1